MKVILAILFAACVVSISGYGHGWGNNRGGDNHRGHDHKGHDHKGHDHGSHGHWGHHGHRNHAKEICDVNKKEHKDMCTFVHKMCGNGDTRFARKQENGSCDKAVIPEQMKKKKEVCLYNACSDAAVTMEVCKILNMTCHHEIKKLIPFHFIHRGICGNCSKANVCRWHRKHHKPAENQDEGINNEEDTLGDENEDDDESEVNFRNQMDEDTDEGENADEGNPRRMGYKKGNKFGRDANKSRGQFWKKRGRRGRKICGSDGVEYKCYCDFVVAKCQAFKKNKDILYIQRTRHRRGKPAKCTKPKEMKEEPEHFYFLHKFVMRKLQ